MESLLTWIMSLITLGLNWVVGSSMDDHRELLNFQGTILMKTCKDQLEVSRALIKTVTRVLRSPFSMARQPAKTIMTVFYSSQPTNSKRIAIITSKYWMKITVMAPSSKFSQTWIMKHLIMIWCFNKDYFRLRGRIGATLRIPTCSKLAHLKVNINSKIWLSVLKTSRSQNLKKN